MSARRPVYYLKTPQSTFQIITGSYNVRPGLPTCGIAPCTVLYRADASYAPPLHLLISDAPPFDNEYYRQKYK